MIKVGMFYVCLKGKALQQVLDVFGCVKPEELIVKCKEVGLEGTFPSNYNLFVISSYKGTSFEKLQEFVKKMSPYIAYGDGYYFLVGMGDVSFDTPIKIII